ncbi:hypothetical protein C8Q80DRAFT_1092132 [Daedaleopsis nitida]|nr:hypothetical protein C8Q80DRAFT_1092132 [Daedaleopsis nitida]
MHDDIFALPLEEIVHTAVSILSERTRLIAWGALLDCLLGLPRVLKNFTFLVPDEELDDLSAILNSLHLPIGTLPTYVVSSEGDFLLRGRLHRVSVSTSPQGIQCLHLFPASLPGYIDDELEPTPLDRTSITLYAPRPSAVYAGILRIMRKYRQHCAERYRLQSDLELLVNYNLLELEKPSVLAESFEVPDMDDRVETAVERIRRWGKAGEWRPGEEFVEDLLIAIVKGEMYPRDLPALELASDEKTLRVGGTSLSGFEARTPCLPEISAPPSSSTFSSSAPTTS